MNENIPNEKIAAKVAAEMLGIAISNIHRLKTGSQNYVYEINNTHVIRLTTPQYLHHFKGAMFWQEKLLPLNIPLARIISYDFDSRYSPFPTLLFEKLAGTDLRNVLSKLTDEQKRTIAHQIVDFQKKVSKLPEAKDFGYATSYENTDEFKTWPDFIVNQMAGHEAYKDQELSAIFERIDKNLMSVRPTPFMDDTTGKNVLIKDGKLTGIVDVDFLCFGDPLFVPSLAYAGFVIDELPMEYIAYWEEALQLNESAKARLAFYKLLHLHSFIRQAPTQTSNGAALRFDVDIVKSHFDEQLNIIQQMTS